MTLKSQMNLESKITNMIESAAGELDRPDLFRKPLTAFSAADDARYAKLKEKIGPWHLLPSEILPNAKSVISYFVPFTKEVARHPKTADGGSALWAEAYQEINRRFVNINERVSAFLRSLGFEAESIRPTHTYSPEDLKCMWSHRSAAVIAGLGSFGANGLVITEKGSGGRFCSVITDAVLKPSEGASSEKTKCLYLKSGKCGLCFRACPVNALSPESLAKFTCQDKLNENQKSIVSRTRLYSADICGKCISVCPFAYIE